MVHRVAERWEGPARLGNGWRDPAAERRRIALHVHPVRAGVRPAEIPQTRVVEPSQIAPKCSLELGSPGAKAP